MMNLEMIKLFEDSFGGCRLDSKSRKYLEKFALAPDEINKFHSEFTQRFGDYDTPEFRISVKNNIGNIVERATFLLKKFEHERIRRIAAISGDDKIIVIELMYFLIRCRLAFQFPLDLDFLEVSSGSAVAEDVFDRPIRDFVVFGPSLSWFKLALNDEDDPVQIWHFSEESLRKGW